MFPMDHWRRQRVLPAGWEHGGMDKSSSYLEHLIGAGTGSGSEVKDVVGALGMGSTGHKSFFL